MRRVSTVLIASLTLAVCLGTVLTASISQGGGGWISAPLASARAWGSSLVTPKGLPGLPNLRGWLTRNAESDAAQAVAGAVVQTDKTDYAPGETAIITGSGFQAGETVTLQVVHTDGTAEGGSGHAPWAVVADAGGGISAEWFVNPDDSVGSSFVLTAVGGSSSLTAQTTFTDDNIGTYDQCSNDHGTGYTSG